MAKKNEHINIEDLTRNSWMVYAPGSGPYFYPVQVDGFKDDVIYVKNPEWSIDTDCEIKELLPIPLSKDLLENIGFEYDDYMEVWRLRNKTFKTIYGNQVDCPYVLEAHSNNTFDVGIMVTEQFSDNEWFMGITTIKYLHELQNVLNQCKYTLDVNYLVSNKFADYYKNEK